MLVSTKDVRTWLQNAVIEKIAIKDSNPDFDNGYQYAKTQLLHKLGNFEQEKILRDPEKPYAEGLDIEQALIVYCTPKLYEFIEKFEDVEDINLIMVGKLWLEVKKFLKEGKFKRA